MNKIKKYGTVGIITHLTISWSMFGLIYLIVSRAGQTDKIIKWFRLEQRLSKGAGNFAIAAVIYKTIMPVRIAISLMAIPIVVKKLNL
jgi:hypothetical protein